MSYPRLAMRLYNTPLVITSEKLEAIERVFRMHEAGTPKLLQPFEGRKERALEVAGPGEAQRTRAGYVRTSDGIAIVQVLDSLVQRANGLDAASGLTSYESISAQISAAMADSQVRGILLEVDSPGGEVPGVFDLGRLIRNAAEVKPTIAHANEFALSGGYVLASAASEIYAPQTGLVGSIGVRMAHIDQSKYDEKRGYVYTEITAGERKGDFNPHAPLSDAAREWAQQHVDHTYGIFVEHVAEMRGMESDAVRATAAGVFHADEAVNMGLIDGVATLGETMQMLLDRIDGKKGNTQSQMRAAASADRTFHRSADAEEGTDMADGKQTIEVKVTADELAQAQARGFAEGKKETETAMASQIVEAAARAGQEAQARVAGILQHAEAEGRETLAKHFAFETNMSVEDAAKALAKAPKQATVGANPLAVAMKGTNPKVGPDAPATTGDDDDAAVDAEVAAIMNAGKRPQLKVVGDAE